VLAGADDDDAKEAVDERLGKLDLLAPSPTELREIDDVSGNLLIDSNVLTSLINDPSNILNGA